MIFRFLNILFIISVLLISTNTLFAQTNPEDIALETNAFQEAYYEALKQKGIENYDKAIIQLEKCLELQPENPVIHHELGKNYFFFKQYPTAEKYYIKATELEPSNKWYWIDLYDVYYETKNYNQGVLTLQKIIQLDKKFRDDLLSVYMYTKQYDKALVLINELDNELGHTNVRDSYRLEINAQSGNNASGKSELEKAIDQNPLVEENYISLIYKYAENNQEEKARQVLKKLEQNIPNSVWAQVFLYKYHVNEAKGNEAFASLEKVLESKKIDKSIKFRMFNEFVIFVQKNPSFEPQLQKVTNYFEGDADVKVHKELGKFYAKKKNWNQAIFHLEKALQNDKNDLEANVCLLFSYEEIDNFVQLTKVASDLVDTFPNQPEYYFFAGKGYLGQKNLKKSQEYLETGIDYVVDNPALEKDFCLTLAEVFKQQGNTQKATQFEKRASGIK